jgi:hypothetical protein
VPSLLEHVLHHEGDFLPFQRELLNSDADYTIVHGGVGVGKTRACLWSIFQKCIHKPGQVILIGAKTYKQIEDVVLGPWEEEFPQELWSRQKARDNIIVPALGGGHSVIRCRSMDAPHKWATQIGTTLTGYYLAQAEQLPEELYHKLHSRMRDQKNRPLWFRLYDCNAGSKQQWLYRYLVDSNSPEHVTQSGATCKSIHVKWSDNPNSFSDADIKTARRQLGEARFALEYEGVWGSVVGKVFHLIEGDQIRKDAPSGSGQWYLSVDHGYHFAALLIHRVGQYHFVAREVMIQDHRWKAQLAAVKNMIGHAETEYGPIKLHGLIGDPAGTFPDLSGKRPALNANMQFCQAFDLRRPIQTFKWRKEGLQKLGEVFNDFEGERHLLTIHPRNIHLIRSLEDAEWNDAVDDTLEYYDHLTDALRYYMMSRER